jgi:DNA-binding CsgD family transcriptional regulator
MGSGNWDGPPPVRYESQKSRQDWLQNLAPEDDVPLGELGLDPTLVGFLEGNDIRGVAQLVSLTEEELIAVRSLGSGKAAKIRAGLERFGWRLGDVSSFSEGRRRLHSALAEQSLEAESEQREAKDLVWPLVSDGCSVDRIVESTGLPEAAVREARNAWMVEQRIAGASNRMIGETVGMSAEAVRRSIMRADNLDSGHIRELRAARLEGSIRDTAISMPGSSLDEIAEKAGISRNVVRRKLTRLGTKLVWDVNRRNRSRVKKWSDEQLLQALQTASTGSTPLTVTAYDGLVTRGDIKGPTGQVFFVRFGSWRKACEAAGVQCGESARDNYTREWSETDLEALVVEFLFSSEHDGSFVEFQRWLDERPNYPSMATIRNRLGRWGSMKQKAVEEIVAAGRFAELCALCD